MILAGGAAPGGAGASQASPPPSPIQVDSPLESSDIDLGRLIDQKVEGLGVDEKVNEIEDPAPARSTGSQRAVPAVKAEPASIPLARPAQRAPDPASVPLALPSDGPRPASTAVPAVPALGPELSLSAIRERAAQSAANSKPGRRSDSGSRPGPRFDKALGVASPAERRASPVSFVAAGIVSGAVVGGATALLGSLVPASLLPPVPAPLTSIAGANLGVVILSVVLGAAGALLGGLALPPAGVEGASPVSAFRLAVASGLVGLLAGIGITLVRGGLDVVGALVWLGLMAIAGILAAPIASALSSRG